MKLDLFDRRILSELQSDCSRPIAEIADLSGLTTTPCWRRIQKLESAGYVRKRVALLDRRKLGVGTTVFMLLRAGQHTLEWVENFRRTVAALPQVVEAYRMGGDVDYLIKALVSDIAEYDALYKELIGKIALADVSSIFVIDEIKATTEAPIRGD